MRHVLAMLLAALGLVGCASMERIDDAERRVAAETDRATSSLRQMHNPETERRYLSIVEDGQYVAPTKVEQPSDPLPACDITFAPVMPMSLLQFGQQVSKTCGISVRITPDAIEAIRAGRLGGAGDLPPPLAAGGVTLPPPTGLAPGADRAVDIRFKGDVSALLSAVTSRLGLSWRYRDGAIAIYYLDTRNFAIHSIPTRNRMESVVTSGTTTAAGISQGITGGSSGSGTSGGVSGNSGSTQTTTVSMDANISEDLPKAIESMLTPGVGRFFLAPSTQTLTVTDTPEVLDRVGAYIDDLNRFATKSVLLHVKVVNVSATAGDELGIDWNLVYEDIARSYNVGLAGGFAVSPDAVGGSVNILEGSRFDGSRLVVNALAKQGSVSVVTEPSVTTLNMESVPIQVARQTSFLASVQISQTANVGTTSALTPGTVTTGFNMTLLPYILPDDETILLSYNINLSALDSIRRVESGGSAIEIPEVNNRIFSQKVRIKTGQTLVLSGFEQDSDNIDRAGVGSARFFGLGGGARHRKQRDVLVVMITPIVMR